MCGLPETMDLLRSLGAMSEIMNDKMKKKILVVDNHSIMLELMTKFLAGRGYQVKTAVDGLSALSILKDFIPDVMFIDLIMPNIDGEKLCRIIRSSLRLTEVSLVVISAVAVEEEVNIAEIGADACIAKGPFDKMSKHILQVLDQLDKKGVVSKGEEYVGAEDISARTITKELLSAKRHFELILENITEGILELNQEGKIIYLNRSAAALAGAMEEALLSKDFIELFGKPDRPKVEKLLKTVQENGEPIHEKSPLRLNQKQILMDILPVKDEDYQSIIVILKTVAEGK